MQRSPKEWMVRTRAGEVLGPYTQRELMEELKRNLFSVEDEIAPSQGHWISAQALAYHETEELTSTRSHHPFTQSITSDIQTSPGDLPLPPEVRRNRPGNIDSQRKIRIPGHLLPRTQPSKFNPVLLGFLVVAVALSGVVYLRNHRASNQSSQTEPQNSGVPLQGESAFVRQIYSLIHGGKTQAALKALTLYHERGPAKNDVEYLVPYAALLILEGESPSRARKFLDQVIDADTTAYLKSRAHLWLGYLALMTDKLDQAEGHFLEALQMSPKDPAARFNLGRTYLKQEKYSLALDYLQLAELEAPDLWLIQIYKGRAKFALEQPADAQVAFKASMENSPDRWITYIYYALFLAQTQRAAEGQKILKQMLTRDPHYEVLSPPPFGYYQEKINYTEYLNAFTHVMEKASGEEKEVGRRYIQYLLTNTDEGGRIETLAEKGGLTARVLGLKLVLDREATGAEVKHALARLPESLDSFGYYAYVLRGEAYGRLGLFDEAKRDFRRSLDLAPHSAIGLWAYATLLQKVQSSAEAQSQVKELLRYHPNYIPAIVSAQNL